MKIHVPTLTLIAAIVFGSPFTGLAAKKKTAPDASPTPSAAATPTSKASPTPNPDRPIPYHGTISAVDKAAKTFSIQGKEKTRVFKITDQTKVTKGADLPATWDDIKVGELVRGSGKKTGEGTYDANSVKLGPKEPAAPKKK